MIHPKKCFWGVRALLYNFRFLCVGFPSYIGRPMFIEGAKGISLGKRVRIFPGLRIQCIGDKGKIKIEDDVYIGQNCHITSEGSTIRIGSGATILSNIFITNIDHDYRDFGVPVLKQKHLLSETEIGDCSFIGYGAAIQAGVILGKHCVVGAHSVVCKGSYPDGSVLVGAPARIVKQYDKDSASWVSCLGE